MDGYTRISKQAARKLFDADKPFYIQSVNMRPCNMWQSAMLVNKSNWLDYDKEHRTFDMHVNEFEFFNCDNERGRYAAFYIKEEVA